MSDHYNGLTPAEDERLTLLAEECAEVIVAVAKIQRHGYGSGHPESTHSNRWDLEREIGHINNALGMMVRARDIDPDHVQQSGYQKARTIAPYLHHQGPTE